MDATEIGNGHGISSKPKLLTLSDIDGRTRAAQAVRQTMADIAGDLGGPEHLTTAEQQLVKRAAMHGAMLEDLGARWLSGEPVDPALYATLSNAERRLLETIGLRRRARDVTPSLSAYLAARAAGAGDA